MALALVAVTLFALAVRLYDLGGRVFHWDEGRVGYWTLRYAETGEFAYAPIIHGPFLRIVNASVFGVLPPTDATARLVVALVGGLLPLSAWLFRRHLDRAEVVALGGFLAFTPLLVYYSRFMRNDVLVGAFAFVALGFAVRSLDTRRVWYLYPAAFFLALSLTTKANTLLYVLCFAGASTLVADHRFLRDVRASGSPRAALASWWRRLRTGGREAAGDWPPLAALAVHLLGLTVVFLGVIVFFYAPRPMLYQSLGSPGMWSAVVHEATVGSARELVDLWIAGDMQEGNPYFEFLRHELETLSYGAAVVCVFALVGFVVDGYGTTADADQDAGSDSESGGGERVGAPAGRNRAFVAFAAYWALASLVGYPAATDINAPWSAVHIAIPLTIPAAVGVVYVVREGLAAWGAADRETAVLAALVLLVATGGLFAPTATYWNSADPDQTEVVQWSQPHNDLRESLDDAEAAIAAHDGDPDNPDILFVGSEVRDGAFYVSDESVADDKGATGGWYDRLPLPWYYERAGGEVTSIPADADRAAELVDAPPVVVAHAEDRETVDPHLDGYVAREHQLRLWDFPVVIYVEESALEDVE